MNNDYLDEDSHSDEYPPPVFNERRHTETIEGINIEQQSWRMKERMKTVSVALVMCLNVGVDPPDIVKPHPCSKLECWIDPATLPPQKALEAIGSNLLKQYERWQPRARYKQSLDPTVEEVKKLCSSLRRNAKDERVLFHYNGHGVPKPTVNGEIWVFNRSYTQYIPLSIYDLQQWMGAPSIYVYDCSCAGLIVDSFKQFAVQHEKEYEMNFNRSLNTSNSGSCSSQSPPQYKHCIQLAACSADQLLPMNPDLPADLFTSCLTTPIKIALIWFVRQSAGKLVPGVTLDILEKIPGQLTDRRTMLGELNWIFTAITDTIAWNVLPKDLFQRLFRQDLLVASLFRNFLLAERIMRSYDCTPVSSPALPPTFHHPMWQAWDLAVDICLSQLPAILEGEAHYRQSPFFAEQLTAFQVWLSFGSRTDSHPEQLPIVLQVLLSQVHRSRALELLGGFLDLGPSAVNLALSVGIFPYVLKLLQSSARELRPLLVFIWAKILAVDGSCQADLVRDSGHRYFLSVLSEPCIPSTHRTMAAFVMACIVKHHANGQEVALQGNAPYGDLIDHCLEQLNDPNPLLRQWLAICLGRVWENYEKARWIGARNTAHEKLFVLLDDPVPEVRAAAVFALGTFINSVNERTDHANAMDHSIAKTLINKVQNDSNPLVRMELIVALQWLVLIFENNFLMMVHKQIEEEKNKETKELHSENTLTVGTPPVAGLRKVPSRDRLSVLANKFLNASSSSATHAINPYQLGEALTPPNSSYLSTMKRVNSSTSLGSSFSNTSTIINVYTSIWNSLRYLSNDPFPDVASKAQTIIDEMKNRVLQSTLMNESFKECHSEPSFSEPASPNTQHSYLGESPTATTSTMVPRTTTPIRDTLFTTRSIYSPFQQFGVLHYSNKRKIFEREPNTNKSKNEDGNDETSLNLREPIVTTQFVEWCTKHFSQPVFLAVKEMDPEGSYQQEREWRMMRNNVIRKEAKNELACVDPTKIQNTTLFHQKNPNIPDLLAFHPYEPRLVVAERDTFSIWNWDFCQNTQPQLIGSFSNLNAPPSRITSMKLINEHDNTLILSACCDGTTRIWRNCGLHNERIQQELVTAFHLFSDMQPIPKGPGVVLHWNQRERKLIASGDTRSIRLWDAMKEMKIRDLSTGADCGITAITTDEENLICVGCMDGSVRVFDDRLMPQDSRVLTYYEQKNWILNVEMRSVFDKNMQILSGSLAGDIKWYDKRWPNSIKTINTGIGMSAMKVHLEAEIFACALANPALASGYQSINLYSLDGIAGSTLRNYEGYHNQRMGPVCSLAFHTNHMLLAAGSTDSFISIYGNKQTF